MDASLISLKNTLLCQELHRGWKSVASWSESVSVLARENPRACGHIADAAVVPKYHVPTFSLKSQLSKAPAPGAILFPSTDVRVQSKITMLGQLKMRAALS